VVLCDIGLPDMDGYAVAKVLRCEAGLKDTLLVALTGYALPADKERAAEAGFDAHLTKPVTVEGVEEVMSRGRSAAGVAASP
jgi:two-component system CheB/CheR fusion protein